MRQVLIVGVVLLGFIALIGCESFAEQAGKWPGVDETVVEKYAKAAGREPWEPLINTDQGDLLLFAFLIAGVLGGFVMGYHFRTLFPPTSEGTRGPPDV